ncbi:1173_t:CDS:1, partial [Acaulospora morrowiae]
MPRASTASPYTQAWLTNYPTPSNTQSPPNTQNNPQLSNTYLSSQGTEESLLDKSISTHEISGFAPSSPESIQKSRMENIINSPLLEGSIQNPQESDLNEVSGPEQLFNIAKNQGSPPIDDTRENILISDTDQPL